MCYELRPMEPEDVPVVAAIDRLSFPTPWPAAAFRRELLRPNAHYSVLLRPGEDEPPAGKPGWVDRFRKLFGVVRKSRVIGYVGFRQEGDEGHLTTIAVHPDWRGKGFGEFLLLVAIDKVLNLGLVALRLEMRPSNDVAYELYRKYDLEVKRRRSNYYHDGDDAWAMKVYVNNDRYRDLLSRRRESLKERFHRDGTGVGQMGRGPL